MSKLIGPILVIAVLVGGIVYLTRPKKETLGQATGTQVTTTQTASGPQTVAIGDITADKVGQTVQIEGTIAKECPHTGCWAVVEDETGEIRIDTKKGAFALPLGREGSKIKVVGDLEVKENGDLEISATSAEL